MYIARSTGVASEGHSQRYLHSSHAYNTALSLLLPHVHDNADFPRLLKIAHENVHGSLYTPGHDSCLESSALSSIPVNLQHRALCVSSNHGNRTARIKALISRLPIGISRLSVPFWWVSNHRTV